MKYRNQFLKFYMHSNTDGEGGGGGGTSDGTGDSSATASDAGTGETVTAEQGKVDASPAATGGKDGTDSAKGYWPEDWLSKVSKGDEKLSKQLGRYASPEAMAEALVAAQSRIRSGEFKAALPKDPKPEELAQWRKDNGVPEKPEDYDLKFDSGLVIGDDDKPFVDGFLKAAHEKNMTPDQVKSTLDWYYQEQERQADERLAKDDGDRQNTLDSLNNEWGQSFRRNINMIDGLLSKAIPAEALDSLKAARLPDGTAVFNHPDILRGLASLALEVNPAGTLVPNAGADPVKSVDEEISKIEKTMREDRKTYNKDEKMQARYRELLVAKEKLVSRAS